jgi:hypothetical protein
MPHPTLAIGVLVRRRRERQMGGTAILRRAGEVGG